MSACLIDACAWEARVCARLDIATSLSCRWYWRELQVSQLTITTIDRQTAIISVTAERVLSLATP
ncbi:hypothetical protein D3C81_1865260 [compost metagenome]